MPNVPPYHREVAESQVEAAEAQKLTAEHLGDALQMQRSSAVLAKLGLGVALLSALFAAFSAWNSYKATENARLSSQGALLFQMSQLFFYTEPHKEIIRRLEEGVPLRKATSTVKRKISDEELDNHIGFLDTLGTYVKEGIIDLRLADTLFGHYVESAFESKEIQQYVKEVKESGSADFDDFVWLYNEVKTRGKK